MRGRTSFPENQEPGSGPTVSRLRARFAVFGRAHDFPPESMIHRLLIIVSLAFAVSGGKGTLNDLSALEAASWKQHAAPEALAETEEQLPMLQELAERYNPAMAFAEPDIWPTAIDYTWHDGANLIGRVVARTGKVVREYVAFANQALASEAWADLPREDGEGNAIEYWIDAPGDDRKSDGVTGWLHRWRDIMGAADGLAPVDTPYPPTQYAHVFWYNRAEGLLGIQYWFYYPFDDWINRHEGDWEHINIILKGPDSLTADNLGEFKPVGYQYFFHAYMHEPETVMRVQTEQSPGDHVMVFAGGHSRFLAFEGSYSGGSYPLPALYPGAGGGVAGLRPYDDTSRPQRFIAPEDFQVVVLPEPERLDAEANPELSWLKLPFFAGQRSVFTNPFIINIFSPDHTPPQPGMRADWNAQRMLPLWNNEHALKPQPVELPDGWRRTNDPSLSRPGASIARQGLRAGPS